MYVLREISKIKTTIWGLQNVNSRCSHVNNPYNNFILLKCCCN